MRWLLFLLLGVPACLRAEVLVTPHTLCRGAIAAAERSSGVPDRLMQAIGVVESGKRDGNGAVGAWPWTINAEGAGSWFATKAEAMAAVVALQARGVRSIDVGCMQVNLMHHGSAFPSLEDAFDPAANARYAARFLLQLLNQTGSWPAATAGYHSLTPEIGGEYARKVLAVWARPAQRGGEQVGPFGSQAGPASTAVSSAPVPAAGTPSLGGGARVIPIATPIAGVTVGRGLDAYRAAPTRLAGRVGASRVGGG